MHITYLKDLMNKLLILIQTLLPHHLLSRCMQWLTKVRWPAFKNLFIQTFVRLYKVDMSLAQEPEPTRYQHFNDFFTRALRPEARPVINADDAIACPVDGTISQSGVISDDQIFQAKGFNYSLNNLLGGASDKVDPFRNGQFATIYLSPRDYHRIHMPVSGRLLETIYVPGRLFSVNKRTTEHLPNLFARNERLVTLFETDTGPMALILVGALFVSGIETVWDGPIARQHSSPHRHLFDSDTDKDIILNRGEEMGRFNMGSTVILLFNQSVTITDKMQANTPVQMGQLLGNYFKTNRSN